MRSVSLDFGRPCAPPRRLQQLPGCCNDIPVFHFLDSECWDNQLRHVASAALYVSVK